jgi:hypothetical protein
LSQSSATTSPFSTFPGLEIPTAWRFIDSISGNNASIDSFIKLASISALFPTDALTFYSSSVHRMFALHSQIVACWAGKSSQTGGTFPGMRRW